MLAHWLRDRGREVVETIEPGGTGIGQQIRRILLNPENFDLRPRTELLLYFASRAQNVEQVIRPALEAGKVVLCDRFTDSTLVYQGCGRGLEAEVVLELDRIACRGLRPDLTLLIDIDLATSLARAKRRNERRHAESASTTKVRRSTSACAPGILRLPATNPIVSASSTGAPPSAKWRRRYGALSKAVFENFFGNRHVQRALEGMLERNRVPQTMLFAGLEGLGKATLARRFAARPAQCHARSHERIEQDDLSLATNADLIAEREKLPADKRNDDPLFFGAHPDFLTFPPDGPLRQLSIPQMRLLKERAQYKPGLGRAPRLSDRSGGPRR